jgi:hypothetical protein
MALFIKKIIVAGLLKGRAIAQVVSRRFYNSVARDRSQVSACGIFGGQNGTGTGFSTTRSVFPCQYHSTAAPYSLVSSGVWIKGLLAAAIP